MRMLTGKETAVSPVVGVMLMLVVTIIIAAVVSGFAGGLAGNTAKAPQASIVAKEFVVNEAYDANKTNNDPNLPTGKCSDVYVVFEHKGGDGINLNDIEIHLGSLKYAHEKTMISNGKTVNTTAYGNHADIASAFSRNWNRYIRGYPDGGSMVSTGSKFVLHADYVRERIDSDPRNTWKRISWSPDGAAGAFSIDVGDYLTFDIIDRQSRKTICSGQIQVPDFAVASS